MWEFGGGCNQGGACVCVGEGSESLERGAIMDERTKKGRCWGKDEKSSESMWCKVKCMACICGYYVSLIGR